MPSSDPDLSPPEDPQRFTKRIQHLVRRLRTQSNTSFDQLLDHVATLTHTYDAMLARDLPQGARSSLIEGTLKLLDTAVQHLELEDDLDLRPAHQEAIRGIERSLQRAKLRCIESRSLEIAARLIPDREGIDLWGTYCDAAFQVSSLLPPEAWEAPDAKLERLIRLLVVPDGELGARRRAG